MGTICEEALLQRSKEAFSPFRLCSTCAVGLSPHGNPFGSFATWDFFLFSFPPFRWSGEEGGVSGCTWCCVPEGFLPSRWISVQRDRWECFWSLDCRLLRASALPLLWLLRELAKGELLVRSGLPLAHSASSVVSPHSSPHTQRRIERDFGGPLPRVILS